MIDRLKIDGGPSAPTGRLDLTNNPLLVADDRDGILQDMRSLLRAGMLGGRGITSTTLNPDNVL